MISRLVALLAAALAVMASAPAHAALTCDELAPFGLPVAAQPEPDAATVCEQSPDHSVAYFLTHYDRAKVAPRWVAYTLTRAEMIAGAASGITRKKDGRAFAADPAIEADGFRSPTNRDYVGMKIEGIAYDRGHYAPAEAMQWSLEGYRATFVVSNIAPQVHVFNSGVWGRLEDQERGWACDHGAVHVVTGVIFGGATSTRFNPAHRPDLHIFVPTHFWKVAYAPADGKAIAFVFKNSTHPGTLAAAMRSVRQLEAVAGLNFHPSLAADAQERAENVEPDQTFWRLDHPGNFKCGQ
jgi:endonuclease G